MTSKPQHIIKYLQQSNIFYREEKKKKNTWLHWTKRGSNARFQIYIGKQFSMYGIFSTNSTQASHLSVLQKNLFVSTLWKTKSAFSALKEIGKTSDIRMGKSGRYWKGTKKIGRKRERMMRVGRCNLLFFKLHTKLRGEKFPSTFLECV